MTNFHKDEEITCDILIYNRRKIKKLINKKKYIIEHGKYAIYFHNKMITYFISDFPTNGKLIIPYTNEGNNCNGVYIDPHMVNTFIRMSKLGFCKKLSSKYSFRTFFMFDNKSELAKWKLKHA